MKNKTIIRGYSDDILLVDGREAEGNFKGVTEEFSTFKLETPSYGLLALSDGTLLRVQYDEDGIWRLSVKYQGTQFVEKIEGSLDDGGSKSAYSNDEVHMDGPLRWAVLQDVINDR